MTRRVALGVEYLSDYRAGIARVGTDLFAALMEADKETEYILVANRENTPEIRASIQPHKQVQQSIFQRKLPDPITIPLWVQFQLPRILNQLKLDLYLHTGMPPLIPFLPPWQKIKKLIFLHDVINVKHPQFFKPITFLHGSVAKWLALRSFDHIFCNSVATKNDAVGLLRADPQKITVVHLGLSKAFRQLPSQEASHRARRIVGNDDLPFVLFVGTIEPRKNLEGLLHGFKLSGLSNNHRLVVAGARGWKTSGISKTLKRLDLDEKVVFCGFVPDEELSALYRLASVFCYPSLDEGFGLPVLEAMACGCPVVTSEIPALREVGGDIPIYVNPRNTLSIASALKKVAEDNQCRKTMAQRGIDRAKRFSWDRAALDVLKVIDKIIYN
jgi:glycosyltransferase involved in cell wall biosynthesis